jgi:hypothetical protein
MACIIFWQAKEIHRVILDVDSQNEELDWYLLEHISPVGWSNLILYGEYVLDPELIRPLVGGA